MNKQIINLITDGKVKTKDREFTRVIGGFGEDKPIITDKQIADILEYSNGARTVRERLNRKTDNKKRNLEFFQKGLDILDLKSSVADNDTTRNVLKTLGYTEQAMNLSKNIYIFSQSGFLLFLKFAEGETSIELYKEFLEDYFKTKAENKILKATIQEQIQNLKETYYITFGKGIATGDNKLLMESQNINNQIIELEKRLTEELTVRKYKIYEDKYKQFMDSDNCFSFENASKILSTTANGEGLNIKVNKITLPKILRNKGILSKERKGNGYKNIPNSKYEEYFNVTTYEFEKNGQTHNKVKSTITSKGLDFIYNLLKEGNKIA
ncbi:hypothetical protein FC831_10735 [Clostridium botulinum]|nr:hypothetical protein [Clostridium botulinum]